MNFKAIFLIVVYLTLHCNCLSLFNNSTENEDDQHFNLLTATNDQYSDNHELTGIDDQSNEIHLTPDDGDAKMKRELSQLFGIEWDFFKNQSEFGDLNEPPEYMIDLYQSVADDNGVTKGDNPFNAHIVRSYTEQADYSIPEHFLFNVDVSGIDEDEKILEAELRLYRYPIKLENETLSPLPYILLKVYQIIDANHLQTPDLQKLLSVHCVSAFSSGWQVFNIKQAIISWTQKQEPNLGLLISATTIFGSNISIQFARKKTDKNSLQPIIVVYSDDNKNRPNTKPLQIENNILNIFKRSIFLPTENSQNKAQQNKTKSCQREDLLVDFNKLGWSNFIIAPPSYNAYNCKGSCFSLDKSQNHSNYAIIKNLLNDLNIINQPLCCTPKKFSHLTVLYYQNENQIVLRKYDQMIVKECECK